MSGRRPRLREGRSGGSNGRVVTERPKTAVKQKPGQPLTLDARFTMLKQLRGQASQRQAGAREAVLAKKRGVKFPAPERPEPAAKEPSRSVQQEPDGSKGKRKGQKMRGPGQRPTSPANKLANAKRRQALLRQDQWITAWVYYIQNLREHITTSLALQDDLENEDLQRTPEE